MDPFDVGAYLLTAETFKGLSLRNAELRDADAAHGFGFYDCNSLVGEARSHAAFLVGLADGWVRRQDRLTADERRRYLRQIGVAVDYLLMLQDPRSGRFTDNPPMRRAPNGDKPIATPYAVWALATALGEFGPTGVLDAARLSRIERRVAGRRYLQGPGKALDEPDSRPPSRCGCMSSRESRATRTRPPTPSRPSCNGFA